MIYLSDPLNRVVANDSDLVIARNNTKIIHDYLTNPDADDFDIMVDVGGIIYLAPYDDGTTIHSILDGNVEITPTFLRNTANWCLTFQYGSSFATRPGSTNMSFKNFQIEASEKAFLFETNDAATKVNVTELYNSVVSVCPYAA